MFALQDSDCFARSPEPLEVTQIIAPRDHHANSEDGVQGLDHSLCVGVAGGAPGSGASGSKTQRLRARDRISTRSSLRSYKLPRVLATIQRIARNDLMSGQHPHELRPIFLVSAMDMDHV